MGLDITTCVAQERAAKERTHGDYRYARNHDIDRAEMSVLPCDQCSLVRDPASVRRLRECVPLARRALRRWGVVN